MKTSTIVSLALLAGVLAISGCQGKNNELKTDAREIAEAMCKSMEAMNTLRAADPADSALVHRLQSEYKDFAATQSLLYEKFRSKYGEKTDDRKFNTDFRKYLNAAMLDCKSLSKEDREAFQRGME